jgi:glycosyltransferase involved in cell wall biosynthesis
MTTTKDEARTQGQHSAVAPPALSIVIPVYNEVGNIRPLQDEIDAAIDERTYEVLWVEDGATDDSPEIIDELAASNDHVRAIHLARNVGQSASLAAGIDEARGDIIVTMDGDRQNDPADIPNLVETLVDGDYACVSGVRANRQDGLGKRVPSNIQTQVTKRMAPNAGSDMGCTLKAYSAYALNDIQLRGEHHRYIPAKLARRGYSLTEQEVNHRARPEGESSYGTSRLVRGFLDAVFHLLLIRWGARPIHFFGTIGLGVLSFGGLLGGHMLLERLVLGNPIMQHMPRLILIAVLTLGGLLLLMLGVLAEMLTRLEYRDEEPYRIQEVVE